MGKMCTPSGYVTQAPLCTTRVLDRTRTGCETTAMPNRLKFYRERKGLTQEELGKRLNSGRSTVTKFERGERPLTPSWLDRIAKELDCAPLDILGDEVPVVGKIGAGGSVIYEDVGNEDTIKRPPETPGVLVGLEVAGESMLPKYDPGDVIFISRDSPGVDPEDIGAYCACRLRTGETYLKKLARGSRPGLYTLRSLNGVDIEDVELEWATPVRASIPRHARNLK